MSIVKKRAEKRKDIIAKFLYESHIAIGLSALLVCPKYL